MSNNEKFTTSLISIMDSVDGFKGKITNQEYLEICSQMKDLYKVKEERTYGRDNYITSLKADNDRLLEKNQTYYNELFELKKEYVHTCYYCFEKKMAKTTRKRHSKGEIHKENVKNYNKFMMDGVNETLKKTFKRVGFLTTRELMAFEGITSQSGFRLSAVLSTVNGSFYD